MGNSDRGHLARVHEQRETARRERDWQHAEINRYYAEQRSMDAMSESLSKDEARAHSRAVRQRQAEQQMLNELHQAETNKQLAAVAAAESEAVAAALARQVQVQLAGSKEVQRLREESAELRELAEKIRAARVNKERVLQLEEKARLAAQEAEYNRQYDTVIMRQDAAGLAQQQAADAARRESSKLGMHVLEQQIAERLALQRQAEAEFASERALVDEVVARIQAEDALEAAARRAKQADTKAYIAAFLKEREGAKAAAAAAARAEDAKIAQHQRAVAQREAAEAAKQAARQSAADAIYDKLRREKEAALRAEEEEDRLIDLMREEEAAGAARAAAAAEASRREASRREMLAANAMLLEVKAQREVARCAEEESFRAAMMAKFAEDDRLEQLNAQRRRLKVAEHKRAVDQMLADKRAAYEAAHAAEEAEEAARRAEEARRAGIIADERRRLLETEAAGLADYLPPGALKDRAELERLRATAAAQHQQRQLAASMAASRGGP